MFITFLKMFSEHKHFCAFNMANVQYILWLGMLKQKNCLSQL